MGKLIVTLLLLFLSAVSALHISCSNASQTSTTSVVTSIMATAEVPAAETATAMQTTPFQTDTITTPSSTVTNTGSATFTVSDLHTEPSQPGPDAFFSAVFTVTNTGNSNGIYEAAVLIIEVAGKNKIEIGTLTKSVAVAADESKVVTLDRICLPMGDYELAMGNLTYFFKCI